jgi:hypothetical protein
MNRRQHFSWMQRTICFQHVSCVNAPDSPFNSLSSTEFMACAGFRCDDGRAIVERAARSRDLDQQLSEVLALKQAEESRGRVFQALDHVFAIFEAAAAHPFAGFA